MLDAASVNNNFYHKFQSKCAEVELSELMAPDLPAGARIHMSGSNE